MKFIYVRGDKSMQTENDSEQSLVNDILKCRDFNDVSKTLSKKNIIQNNRQLMKTD